MPECRRGDPPPDRPRRQRPDGRTAEPVGEPGLRGRHAVQPARGLEHERGGARGRVDGRAASADELRSLRPDAAAPQRGLQRRRPRG